jgi:membrane-bound lytic murein transglycosylase B
MNDHFNVFNCNTLQSHPLRNLFSYCFFLKHSFLRLIFFIVFLGSLSLNVYAQKKTPSQNQTKIQKSFAVWKTSLKSDILKKGASQALTLQIMDSLTYIPRVIQLDKRQPEKRMTHKEYLKRVIPDSKIKQAKIAYQDNRQQLSIAEKKTGVPARYIVSLWGKETHFGKITGKYSVLSALATLIFDGRRKIFFKKEFLAAVTILVQGHIELKAMKGSWAGAMGHCQFMPSSFLEYAIDGNGDGKKDIWNNKADIFASMGNYLARYGWKKNQSWGREVSLTHSYTSYKRGKKHKKILKEWVKQGVKQKNGKPLPKASIKAYLIAPDGKKGHIYLVYSNFDILMRWNRSYYFATGVGYLADHLIRE